MRNIGKTLGAIGALAMAVGCLPEARLERSLERADAYFKVGQFEQAEIEYKNVLTADPKNPAAIRNYGVIQQEQGRWMTAAPFIMAARKENTNDLDIRIRAALLYMASGDFTNARTDATFVLMKQPTNTEAAVLLAQSSLWPEAITETKGLLSTLREGGDSAAIRLAEAVLLAQRLQLEGAEAEIRKAIEFAPESEIAYALLGNLLDRQGKPEDAAQALKTAFELAPVRSRHRLGYIDFRIKRAEGEEVKGLLQEMNAELPGFLPAQISLGKIAFDAGNFDEARKWAVEVVRRDPKNLEARSLEARILLSEKKTDQAINLLAELARDYPRLARVHYELSVAYLLNDDEMRSRAELERVLAISPNLSQAKVLMAQILLRQKQFREAETLLQEVFRLEPGNLQAGSLLARVHRLQGNLGEARVLYERLIALSPRDVQAQFGLAQVLVSQQDLDGARVVVEGILELAPDFLPAVELLMRMDVEEKNVPAAMSRIQQEIEKNPEAVGPLVLLARLHTLEGQLDQAQKCYDEILRLVPDWQLGYLAMVQLYVKQGKLPEAQEKLEAVLQRNPTNTLALTQLGVIREAQGDFPGARDHYETLLQHAPDNSTVLNNLAYLYSEQLSNLGRAGELAARAWRVSPRNPYVADTYGWILFRQQNFFRSVAPLQEAATELPHLPEVLYHLGMAYSRTGREDLAVGMFDRALKLNKPFKEKELLEERLALMRIDPSSISADAAAQLRSQLQTDPGDPVVLRRLGAYYERQGETEKHRQMYFQAYKLNPEDPHILAEMAEIMLKDEPARALELARQARQLAPDDPAVAFILGRAAFATKGFELALRLLQESDRKQPGQPELLHELALAYYSVGQVAEAENAMGAVLTAGASSSTAASAERFLAMLSFHHDIAEPLVALNRCREILKAVADYVPAHMVSGLAAEKLQNWSLARESYLRVLGEFPLFVPASRQLAILSAEHLDDDDAALKFGTSARTSLPGDLDLAQVLGKVWYRKANYAYAAVLLAEAEQGSGDDASLLYHLGLAQIHSNSIEEGKRTLTRALALQPDHKMAKEAKEALAPL